MEGPRASRPADDAPGFRPVELAVALVVAVEVALAVLLLCGFRRDLSRLQGDADGMRQSLGAAQYDMVRLVRLAGRGGLPEGASPSLAGGYRGAAVAVRDNVGPDARVAGAASPRVAAGTDVLTVRGVLSTPVYQPSALTTDNPAAPGRATRGTLRIEAALHGDPHAAPGAPAAQDLSALKAAVESGAPEALLIVGVDETAYAVVELDPATSIVTTPGEVTLGFKITGGAHTAAYAGLSAAGGFPAALANAWTVGILEEYRFYVRAPGGPDGWPLPRLARARVFPNTDVAWGAGTAAANAAGSMVDVAEDVADLQVALGFDTNGDGKVTDAGDDRDEWLFNAPGDAVGAAGAWNGKPLYYLRLSLVARAERPDPGYTAPAMARLEDRVYGAGPPAGERRFRRRLLQTIIDLRSLG